MSLSTLLLGADTTGKKSSKGKEKEKAAGLDDGLDALFKTTTSAAALASSLKVLAVGDATAKASKRKHTTEPDEGASSSATTSTKRHRKDKSSEIEPTLTTEPSKQVKIKSRKSAASENKFVEHSNEDMTTLAAPPAYDASDSAPSDQEDSLSTLVHESVSGKTLRPSSRKTKYVPEGETPSQRDQRTIFLGNIPLEVVKSRPLQKQLKRHVLSFVPNARVESMRFRSIAFQKPTAKLPTSDDESSKPSQGAAAPKPKEGRAHDRNRAATWRENQDKDDIALKNDEKKFLRPEEKKKIAFIKGELHNSAATANAYIVFAHPSPSTSPASTEDAEDSNAEGDIKTGEQQTDPYEASRMAVQHANGSQFMERTIRVDFVNAKSAGGDATEMITSDPKRTVFVGNLEFAAKEEDLRVFFEGVVSTELGPPPSVSGDETGVAKLASWVTRVRIVRDKDTQLGKGFAYVQFVDTACVDEIVAMEETKLKFAKRKLRVQRCKTLPGGPKAPSKPTPRPVDKVATRSIQPPRLKGNRALSSAMPITVSVPKGDPTLGSRLASLSKDERKQAKAGDTDRIARRAAKKKAKSAMVKAASKAHGTDDSGKPRIRKRNGGPKGAGSARKEVKKKVVTKRK